MCCAFGGLKWLDSIFRGFISIVASTLLRSGPSVSIFRDDTPWLYGAQSTLFHGPELSLRLTFFLSKAGSKHSKFGVFGCTPSLVCKLAALPRSFSVFHSPKLTFWGDWQFLLPFLPFRFVHVFFAFSVLLLSSLSRSLRCWASAVGYILMNAHRVSAQFNVCCGQGEKQRKACKELQR